MQRPGVFQGSHGAGLAEPRMETEVASGLGLVVERVSRRAPSDN